MQASDTEPLASTRSADLPGATAVTVWLLSCCAMIFAMAVIGAITRLTESGLSIMEWAPVSGFIPPLGESEWERLFALYRKTGEYAAHGEGMTLAEFRTIFWWEYVHRLWGRLIGLVYILPLAAFWVSGRLPASLKPHLLLALGLGMLQGFLGWFMVESGFAERTDVSQYRLVLHLTLALAIYGYLLWLALARLRGPPAGGASRGLRGGALALLGLVAFTIVSGGFVAGLDAGFIYNSFPLMGDGLVPSDYGLYRPRLLNVVENPAAAQFNHRMLAVLSLVSALGLGVVTWRATSRADLRRAAVAVGALAAAQAGLGVAAVLFYVPIWIGALHQAGAILLLSALIVYLRLALPSKR